MWNVGWILEIAVFKAWWAFLKLLTSSGCKLLYIFTDNFAKLFDRIYFSRVDVNKLSFLCRNLASNNFSITKCNSSTFFSDSFEGLTKLERVWVVLVIFLFIIFISKSCCIIVKLVYFFEYWHSNVFICSNWLIHPHGLI